MTALLESVLVFAIVFSAVTIVLVRGFIFEKPKAWLLGKAPSFMNLHLDYLMNCAMCMGFWVGIAGWFVFSISITQNEVINCVLAGFICSAFSILLDRIIYREGE